MNLASYSLSNPQTNFSHRNVLCVKPCMISLIWIKQFTFTSMIGIIRAQWLGQPGPLQHCVFCADEFQNCLKGEKKRWTFFHAYIIFWLYCLAAAKRRGFNRGRKLTSHQPLLCLGSTCAKLRKQGLALPKTTNPCCNAQSYNLIITLTFIQKMVMFALHVQLEIVQLCCLLNHCLINRHVGWVLLFVYPIIWNELNIIGHWTS